MKQIVHYTEEEIRQLVLEYSPSNATFFNIAGLPNILATCTFEDLKQLRKIISILSRGKRRQGFSRKYIESMKITDVKPGPEPEPEVLEGEHHLGNNAGYCEAL